METAFLSPFGGLQAQGTPLVDGGPAALPSRSSGTPFTSLSGLQTDLERSLGELQAIGGWAATSLLDVLRNWWRLKPLEAPDGPAVAQRGEISASDAVDAIMELFDVNMETATTAVGIGRTTPLYWRRTGSSPRPSSVRRLWATYGLALGLKDRLGVAGSRSWLRTGRPSPLDLLSAGDWDGFANAARRKATSQPLVRMFEPSIAAEEPELDWGGPPAGILRVSRSRIRRGRAG